MVEKSPYQIWKENNPSHPVVARQHANVVAPQVEEEVRNERLSICNACDYLDSTKHCNLCGCFMEMKTKFVEASCPAEKW